jgi:uncharacterized protein YndB with AHSA1/START domain
MDGNQSITRQVDLDLDPETAWDAISSADALATWLGDHVEVDLHEGGTGVVVDDGVARDLTVEHVDHGRGWSFRWRAEDEPLPSLVTFELAPRHDGGSRLTITETPAATVSVTRARRWEVRVASLWAYTMAFARVR